MTCYALAALGRQKLRSADQGQAEQLTCRCGAHLSLLTLHGCVGATCLLAPDYRQRLLLND